MIDLAEQSISSLGQDDRDGRTRAAISGFGQGYRWSLGIVCTVPRRPHWNACLQSFFVLVQG